MSKPDYLIVGAGIYGVAAALTLAERGRRVTLLDPGPIPHPLAASTDISKTIRLAYGSDADYLQLADRAVDGWHAWNARFADTLYHEVGVTMLTRAPLTEDSFEYQSIVQLRAHGHAPERLNADEITRRFPAWKPGAFVDGFFQPRAGYAESGRVVTALIAAAQQAGVTLLGSTAAGRLLLENGRVTGVITAQGEPIRAGMTIVCAGAWTPYLVPDLQPIMKATGHPVFHLRPPDPAPFMAPNLVCFTADISRSGWYGFPYHPREKVVKIANHGVGQRLHPTDDPRVVGEADERVLRAMLAETFPALVDAPIVYTRRCLYNDTLDEHFLIDRHPQLAGLTVAAGGSGHGFKFGPLLGDLIADAAEGVDNRWLPKFRWRALAAETQGEEAARYHG